MWQHFYRNVHPTEFGWFVVQYSNRPDAGRSLPQEIAFHDWRTLSFVQSGASTRLALRGLHDVPTLLAGVKTATDGAVTASSPRRVNCAQMLRILINEWTHTLRTAIAMQSARTMVRVHAVVGAALCVVCRLL